MFFYAMQIKLAANRPKEEVSNISALLYLIIVKIAPEYMCTHSSNSCFAPALDKVQL